MAVRTSRAPLIPLRDPVASYKGELFIDLSGARPKLMFKKDNGDIIDLIDTVLAPLFETELEELRNRVVDVALQEETPSLGEQIWGVTREFNYVEEDDQL